MYPLSRTLVSALALLAVAVTAAVGQSFNIDFGGPADAPPSTYAGAGTSGVWNPIGLLAAGDRVPLLDVTGTAGPVDIRQIGGVEILASDDPATTGDDDALLDDMFISYNDPLDVCIWIDHLTDGPYRVITYALTPNDPALQSRVRVDSADQGPIMVGGAWPGAHAEGISYAVHTVMVTGGEIGLHSGLAGALIQSGINGIQISPLPTTDVGEATSPLFRGIRSVAPNPFRTDVAIEVESAPGVLHAVQLLDVAGRVVRQLVVGTAGLVRWDGRDATGRPAAPGVYFVRLVGDGPSRAWKLVRRD